MAECVGIDVQDWPGFIADNETLVKSLVRKGRSYALSIGVVVDDDDMVSIVQEGLLRAVRIYDPSKGAPFPYYARRRVLGHIKDTLRNRDWLTRRERQLVQAWRRGDELSERRSREAARLASQRPAIGDADEIARNVISDAEVEGAALDMAIVRQLMGRLTATEREVCRRYYLDGMTMSAIGTLLGATESWASQVHQNAMRRLRELYAKAS